MGMLLDQVKALTHKFVRKGGKDNRKQQRARMLDKYIVSGNL